MADVRCPRCGSGTVILTSKSDDRKYHVCVNRPRCKGRVPADDVWGDDWGGGKPVARPAYDREPQRRVPPSLRSRLSIKEEWGDDWGGAIPARKPAPYTPQYPRAQKRALAPDVEEPPKPRLQKVSRPVKALEKKEIPQHHPQAAPKVALYTPQYPRAQRRAAAPETEEPPKPRKPIALKKELVPEKKEAPKSGPQKAPKPESVSGKKGPPEPLQTVVPRVYAPDGVEVSPKPQPRAAPRGEAKPKKAKPSRHWWRRAPEKEAAAGEKKSSEAQPRIAPKPGASPERKEPAKPQQPRPSKHAAFLPLYKKTPKKFVPPEKEEPAGPQQQAVPTEETAFGTEGQQRPRWREILSRDIALKKEKFLESQQTGAPEAVHTEPLPPAMPETKPVELLSPVAPGADAAPGVKAPPKLRRRREPQEYLVPRRKKRSMTVIIIALIVAFIAIDGMIYAAVVLRGQGTP